VLEELAFFSRRRRLAPGLLPDIVRPSCSIADGASRVGGGEGERQRFWEPVLELAASELLGGRVEVAGLGWEARKASLSLGGSGS
jgi:hypothetical protein